MSVAQRIELLCREYDDKEFADLVREADAQVVLDRIVTFVRSGGVDPSNLERDLDALEHLFAAVGIDGLTVPTRVYRSLQFGAGHPEVQAWVCPLKACSRAEGVADPDAPPGCPLAGAPLDLVRTRL